MGKHDSRRDSRHGDRRNGNDRNQNRGGHRGSQRDSRIGKGGFDNPTTERVFDGDSRTADRAALEAAHASVRAKFRLPNGALIVVVDAPNEWSANKCWATPMPPEGMEEFVERIIAAGKRPPFFRADLMVYRFPLADGGFETGVKSGDGCDILSHLALPLKGQFPVEWVSTTHRFESDGNVVHWLITQQPVPFDKLVAFVVGNYDKVKPKLPKAHLCRQPQAKPERPRDESTSRPADHTSRPPREPPKPERGFPAISDGAEGLLRSGALLRIDLGTTEARFDRNGHKAHVVIASQQAGEKRWDVRIHFDPRVEGTETVQLALKFTGGDGEWRLSSTGGRVVVEKRGSRLPLEALWRVIDSCTAVNNALGFEIAQRGW
jgi:hypothetical protein